MLTNLCLRCCSKISNFYLESLTQFFSDASLKAYTYSYKSRKHSPVLIALLFSCDIGNLFRNYYCTDMLLRIVEEFPDELKILASSALNLLCRDKEVQSLFKQFNACEKLLK